MSRLERFYPKKFAKDKLCKLIDSIDSDRDSSVNIVDMPTDGDVGGREQLSFPSEFPAGELPDNQNDAAEGLYRRPREAQPIKSIDDKYCPSDVNKNTGHGHIYPRPDGVSMRCGGPKRCDECQKDKLRKEAEIGQDLNTLVTEQEGGKVKQKDTQHGMWNDSYSNDNQFEDADLKLGENDVEGSLEDAVYPPYSDGNGPIDSRYEDTDKEKHNIILHASNDSNEEDRQLWICVDMDGTILSKPDEYQDEQGNQLFGEPLPGAADALREMVDGGARVSIYTARQYFTDDAQSESNLAFDVENFLLENGIEYTDIYIGKKPPCDHFVDDRSIPAFTGDWDLVLDAVRDKLKKVANDPIKDTIDFQGIKMDIEWPTGSVRSYEGEDTYVTHMKADYGYARGIQGNDGEELDIYLVDRDSDSTIAYIIEQVTEDGSYDEDKIVLGATSEGEAIDIYLQHMPAYMLGDVREVPVEKLVNALYGEPEDRRGEEDLVPSEEKEESVKTAGLRYMANRQSGESVGLFIPLPPDLAKQYPLDGKAGEDDSDPHLTVLYIGDVPQDKFQELIDIVEAELSDTRSFELTIGPVGEFTNHDNQRIIHSTVESTGDTSLETVHDNNRQALSVAGFDIKHASRDFKAHITIEYVDEGEEAKFSDIKPKGSWTVNEIELWGLGEPHIIKLKDDMNIINYDKNGTKTWPGDDIFENEFTDGTEDRENRDIPRPPEDGITESVS